MTMQPASWCHRAQATEWKWVAVQRGWQTQDWRIVPIGWWGLSPSPCIPHRGGQAALKKDIGQPSDTSTQVIGLEIGGDV